VPEVSTFLVVSLAFLVAGAAKGVVGFGIQVVALAILTIALDLLTAMAILLAPAIATNIWQSMVGGHIRELLQRLWPFLSAVAIVVFVGALALTRVEMPWLTALLGLVMITYAAFGLSGFLLQVSPGSERWLGPVFGGVNGLLMGMTGSSMVPGTLYLQSLGLPRDMLVQAMGLLYLVAAFTLTVAMWLNGLLSIELGLYSGGAVIPALIGMLAGQKIRAQLPEKLFRRIFFVALLALGLYVLVASL